MSNYAPGPWVADGLGITAIDRGRRFKVAVASRSLLTPEGARANACLIAAAPDHQAALAVARAVIATATGDPS